jgi:tRNA nucleotidyltransferase (CCA-adding enzyme)
VEELHDLQPYTPRFGRAEILSRLRAARLEARLGFHLDPRSEGLIGNALPLLDRTSPGRIRHELEQILAEEQPERALCRLDELGVLQQLHPALRCRRWLTARFAAARQELDMAAWGLAADDLHLVYLALLLYRLEAEPLGAVMARFNIPRSIAADLELLPELRQTLRRLPLMRRPSRIYRALCHYPAPLLASAWTASERAGTRAKLLRYQTEYRQVKTALTGDDLKRMGLRPGPLFGRLLDALRDARLDGRVTTRQEEESLVRKLLKAEGVTLQEEKKS